MAVLEVMLLVVMLAHLIICPYTKVEESFNMQAMHDILYHKLDLRQYDHLEFPGVVPRTFLGPLAVTGLASPYVYVADKLNASKFVIQMMVRGCLGICVIGALLKFSDAVCKIFGAHVQTWMLLITMSQFHFMFYMSRSLPNTFALAVVLMALYYWLNQKHGPFIWASACAIIIFRSELCLLCGLLLMVEIASGRLSIRETIHHAGQAGFAFWCLSVLVDTCFWQRWLWPEGEVLYFNTVLNKSSAWGTSPFLWYFYSVLPRALLSSLLFVQFGVMWDQRSLSLFLPAVGFMILYSVLPHKELRFIIYVFPMLNTVAAVACSRLWLNRKKSLLQGIFAMVAVGHLFVNLTATGGLLYISHYNYPGGAAMEALHRLERHTTNVHVHIDVATAQTGVTRFTQLSPYWRYNKTEGLTPGSEEMLSFTHLCIGATSSKDKDLGVYSETHNILAKIEGYSRVQFDLSRMPPMIVIVKEPKIFILKKRKSRH